VTKDNQEQSRVAIDRLFDYFKHVSTVGTAASVLLVALGGRDTPTFALLAFAASVFVSMLALGTMTLSDYLGPSRTNANPLEALYVLTSGGLLGGGIAGIIVYVLT
jgi:hypothetical protein